MPTTLQQAQITLDNWLKENLPDSLLKNISSISIEAHPPSQPNIYTSLLKKPVKVTYACNTALCPYR